MGATAAEATAAKATAKSACESTITSYDIALAATGLIKKIIGMEPETPLHAIVQLVGKDSVAEDRAVCYRAP